MFDLEAFRMHEVIHEKRKRKCTYIYFFEIGSKNVESLQPVEQDFFPKLEWIKGDDFKQILFTGGFIGGICFFARCCNITD